MGGGFFAICHILYLSHFTLGGDVLRKIRQVSLREGSKKNVKVWSLTKLANPPPPMLKYGLLIVKIFIQFFLVTNLFQTLLKGFWVKKIFYPILT